ncbi:MAG TPA: phosphate ABC transporter substrate-binding protein PstS [Gaiellaceae bacterium]
MTRIGKTALLVAAVAAALAGVAGARTSGTQITGAGSSFVYPLVSTWTPALDQAFGYQVTYGPIGSGGGIAAISSRTVDFGASDAPLSPDQFRACKGCVQIPWALSATSVAYNVPNAPAHLRLNGKVLAGIFLGRIDNWNDPAITRLNKGWNAPDLKITPVFRSDASGTTFNFTDYLSTVSGDFKSKVGNSTQVSFPAGVGAKGSSGVAGVVSKTQGAITYVDVAYALNNHLKFAAIQNAAGKFTYPGLRAIAAAASTVTKVPANNALSIVAPPKSKPAAYPICTFTYVILPTKSAKAAELRKLIFWALTQGQQQRYTAKLLFVPVPKPVLVAAEKTLKGIQAA